MTEMCNLSLCRELIIGRIGILILLVGSKTFDVTRNRKGLFTDSKHFFASSLVVAIAKENTKVFLPLLAPCCGEIKGIACKPESRTR